MSDVVVTRLQTDPGTIQAAARLLSSDETHRSRQFRFEADRARFVVARASLRRLLAARLDAKPASIRLAYGAHGKPGVADSTLRFSAARCEDLAVFAFSDEAEIGVDVEAIRFVCDADDVVARFFSHSENEEYRHLDPSDKAEGFFNCWTRKEAFVKATGEGLSQPLDAFDVSLAPGQPARILRVGSRPGDECGWDLDSFCPAPGFVAAVVSRNHA